MAIKLNFVSNLLVKINFNAVALACHTKSNKILLPSYLNIKKKGIYIASINFLSVNLYEHVFIYFSFFSRIFLDRPSIVVIVHTS